MDHITDLFDKIMITLAAEDEEEIDTGSGEDGIDSGSGETDGINTEDAMVMTEEAPEVNLYWQMTVMMCNVTAFIITLAMNGLSQYIMPTSLRDITFNWQIRIDPATWAFRIWSVIYPLLGLFVVY